MRFGGSSPRQHHRPAAPGPLTQTLVGVFCGATGPRTVLEEGQTTLAVHTRGVVLATANQLAGRVGAALAGVTMAFAPEGGTRGGLGTVATDTGRREGFAVRHPLTAA